MKLTNIKELDAFKEAIAKCRGDVWLTSPFGDKYQLKSLFNQYIAFGALLSDHGDEMELFCQFKDDEGHFMKFFRDYPEVL